MQLATDHDADAVTFYFALRPEADSSLYWVAAHRPDITDIEGIVMHVLERPGEPIKRTYSDVGHLRFDSHVHDLLYDLRQLGFHTYRARTPPLRATPFASNRDYFVSQIDASVRINDDAAVSARIMNRMLSLHPRIKIVRRPFATLPHTVNDAIESIVPSFVRSASAD